MRRRGLIVLLVGLLMAMLVPLGAGGVEDSGAVEELTDTVTSWVVPSDETTVGAVAIDDGLLSVSTTSSDPADGTAPLAASSTSLSSEPQAPGEWPVGNYNLQRTGDASWQEFIRVPMTTKWTAGTTDKVQMNPAIVQDTAYFGVAGSDRRLFSINLHTSQVNWTVQLPGSLIGAPAVTDDWIFVTALDGRLYKIERESGALAWSFASGGSIWGGPLVQDGVVYFGSTDANAYAVDADTGSLLWAASTPEPITAAVTLSPDHSRLIVMSGANEWATALDAESGSQLWQRNFYTWTTPGTMGTAASVAFGNVYFTGLDQKLHIISELTGFDTAVPPDLGSFAQNTPVATSRGIYVGTNNGLVKAFSWHGTPQWTTILPSTGIVSSPVHASNMLFASSTDGTLYGIDVHDGSIVWGYATSGPLFSPPAIASNHLLLGSDDTNLYILNPGTPANETHTPQGFNHYGLGLQSTQLYEADPVSTTTGNFLYQATDLAQPGRGLTTTFIRTYNSRGASVDGPLGYGWTHNWNVHLTVDASAITVTWGDGREDVHASDGSGGYDSPIDIHDVVTATGSGYQLVTPADVVWDFDSNGRLTTVTDRFGNTATVAYDTSGHLASITDASGRTLDFTSNAAGRVTSITDALSRTWSFDYDTAGNLVSATNPEAETWAYGYDSSHRVTSLTDPDASLLITNVYDSSDRVIEQTDGTGASWTYTYGASSTAIEDPNGNTTTYEFDANWRTTKVTDPLGHVTEYIYDAASNLVAVTDALDRSAQFAYDDRGNLTATLDALGHKTAYAYDAANNLTTITDLKGYETSLTYDSAGRLTSVATPTGTTTTATYASDGSIASITDAAGATTGFTYTATGQPSTVTDPLGRTTTLTVDVAGRVTAITDPAGNVATTAYDDADRPIIVTDPLGHTISYTYGGMGQVATVTDANGNTTSYTHDSRGLLTGVTDPLGRTTSLTYDSGRRLATRTDARGLTISYVYDAADRLISIDLPDGDDRIFGYDPAGQLVIATVGTDTTTYTYDEAGRPTVETIGATGMTLERDYDVLGRQTAITLTRDANAALLASNSYAFDAEGRITSVTTTSGNSIDLSYDPVGRLAQIDYPTGVLSTYGYDLAGQLTTLDHDNPDATTSAWEMIYDAAGRRTEAVRRYETTLGPQQFTYTYGYDAAGRLIAASTDDPQAPASANAGYEYDAAGNRTALTVAGVPAIAYTYDAAGQLLSDGATAYDYDAAGNLIARRPGGVPGVTTATYEWNSLGQLTGLTGPGEEIEYEYDALGRRVQRLNYTPATVVNSRFIWDGGNLLLEEANHAISTWEAMAYAGSMLLNREGLSGHYVPLPDATGNVADLTDGIGALVSRYAYSPYGETGVSFDGDDSTDPLISRHTYSGTWGVRDAAGGLLDMRNRMYDPALGRFISRDPFERMTLQPYQYGGGDPISFIDPYGLDRCLLFGLSHDTGGCVGAGVGRAVVNFTNTASTVVTVVASGVTVVCPIPCGPVSGPIATVAGGISVGTGVIRAGIVCNDNGIRTGACAISAAGAATGVAGGVLARSVQRGADAALASGRLFTASGRVASADEYIFGINAAVATLQQGLDHVIVATRASGGAATIGHK